MSIVNNINYAVSQILPRSRETTNLRGYAGLSGVNHRGSPGWKNIRGSPGISGVRSPGFSGVLRGFGVLRGSPGIGLRGSPGFSGVMKPGRGKKLRTDVM